jgi:hypothetical protein
MATYGENPWPPSGRGLGARALRVGDSSAHTQTDGRPRQCMPRPPAKAERAPQTHTPQPRPKNRRRAAVPIASSSSGRIPTQAQPPEAHWAARRTPGAPPWSL